MSLEFNRRSFLKYTAVAAIALAGSSLLTGCDDKYQKTGKFGATLKLMGEHKATEAKYDSTAITAAAPAGTFTCNVNVKCTTKNNNLYVDSHSFQLSVFKKNSSSSKADRVYAEGCVTLPTNGVGGANYTIEYKDDYDVNVTVNLAEAIEDGDKIEFRFWPRYKNTTPDSPVYTRVYCTWTATAKADATTGVITFES